MGTLGMLVLVTFLAGVGGTGLGGVVSALIRRDTDKTVSLLLSFAGGVMLAVVCFDLMTEALFPEGGDQPLLWLVIACVLAGYGIVMVLNNVIDRVTNHEIRHIDTEHPKTADALDELIHADHYMRHKESNNQLFMAGVIMACAIALHNLPEGMVIGASYAAGDSSFQMGSSAILLAIVIGLHNIPEGMAVAVPLIAGGTSRVKSVLVTALSGAPTILGALIGWWLGALGPAMLSIALSLASGAMLYVVFGELLPESILMWKSKLPAFMMLVGVLVGVMIIFI